MRKLFSLTTVASGAAIGMIVAGVFALIGGAYDQKVVRDQLRPQQIYFPAQGKALPPDLNQYAGQQVDTAKEAKAYANDYIGLHPNLAPLKEIYDKGKLAIIQGVGYPNPNRSHFRSMDIWHSAQPERETPANGWLGRYFDNTCAGIDPHVGVSIGPRRIGTTARIRIDI